MTREEARKRVLDYVYGEMPPDVSREFEALAAADPALTEEVASMRLVRTAAASLGCAELPAGVRSRLMVTARRRAELYRRSKESPLAWIERFFLSPAFSGAIVLAVALGVGAHLVMMDRGEDRLTRIDRTEREAALERGEEAAPRQEVAPAPIARAQPAATTPIDEAVPVKNGLRGGHVAGGEGKARTPHAAAAPAERPAAPRPAPMGLSGEAGVLGEIGGRGDSTAMRGAGGSSRLIGAAAPEPVKPARIEAMAAPPPATSESRTAQGPVALDIAKKGKVEKAPAEEPMTGVMVPKTGATGFARPPAGWYGADKEDRDELEKAADRPADPATFLARARARRAAGDLQGALSFYRKAIDGGLAGDALRAALAEAADVARKLDQHETARAFLERLGGMSSSGQTPAGGKVPAAPAKSPDKH